MNADVSRLLHQLYPDFNTRNIEQIMPHFAVDADWPNGMTGGREVGHAAIREYWTNQWQVIDSTVTPRSYRALNDWVILEVHQRVKDMDGALLSDSTVYHSYQFKDGQIVRMDISDEVPDVGQATASTPVDADLGKAHA